MNKLHYRGFSLIELMVALVIVAILSAVALPAYAAYVEKQKMRTSQADLVVLASHMENTFQRTLAYPAATTNTADTKLALPQWQPSADKDFDFVIAASTQTSYTVTAKGKGGLSGCSISLTNANARSTSGCKQGGGSWL